MAEQALHNDRYFAYGSNMNPQRVAQRGLATQAIRGARLAGMQLTFDKAAPTEGIAVGHAALRFAREGLVEGVLYDLASPLEILKMDVFERAPINYSRERVQVVVGTETVVAWTYFANAAVCRVGLRPTQAYLSHLLAGAPYLSAAYVDQLRATICTDD